MVSRLFHSKIFVLFLSMMLIGFLIGYSYSVLTSKKPGESHLNTMEGMIQQLRDDSSEASGLE